MKTKVIFMIVLTIAMSFCVSAPTAKAFTIATDEWTPYEYREGNQEVGLSTEIVLETLKRCGITTPTIEEYPWARAEKELVDGKVNGLYTGAWSEERAKVTKYPSEPIVSSTWVLASVKGKGLVYTGFKDLEGKKIGLVRGYKYPQAFKDFLEKNCQLEYVTDDVINLRKLVHSRVDFVVLDLLNGRYLLNDPKNDYKSVVTLHDKETIDKTDLYFIFSKSTDDALVKKFDEELRKFKLEPEYKKILVKYLGE